MAPAINKDLILLKLLLSTYYGALGCIWPFLTLHMQQLGLTLEEMAVINMILPFAAASVKPLTGVVADKTGKYKHILVFLYICTCTAFTSLLLVPQVETNGAASDTVSFQCSAKQSHLVWQSCSEENCRNTGERHEWTSIKLQNCVYQCENATNIYSPHLCFHRNGNESECIVYNSTRERVVPDIQFQVRADGGVSVDKGCALSLSNYELDGQAFSSVICNTGCAVVCSANVSTPHYENVTMDPPLGQCADWTPLSSSYTFWLYLMLRLVAEVMLSSCYPITDAINLNLTSRFGGHFGQQILFGIFSLGVFAPITGLIVDYVSEGKDYVDFSPCFIMFDILMALSMVIVIIMPVKITVQPQKSMTKGLARLCTNPVLVTIFIVSTILGTMWGYMEIFLYLYLRGLGASRLLIGLTQLVSVIPAIPLLYKSRWVLEKCGNANILIAAFFVYSIRCIGYAYMIDPWWSLLQESTRVVSLYLARLAFTMEANKWAPPELIVTTQSLVFLLHFDVGRGIGSLIGGYLMDILGARTLFQIIAVFAGTIGCVYFAIHHFYLKEKGATFIQQPEKGSASPESPADKEQNGRAISAATQPLLDEKPAPPLQNGALKT